MTTLTRTSETALDTIRALLRTLDPADKLVLRAELVLDTPSANPEASIWERSFLALRADSLVQEPPNVDSVELLSSMRR